MTDEHDPRKMEAQALRALAVPAREYAAALAELHAAMAAYPALDRMPPDAVEYALLSEWLHRAGRRLGQREALAKLGRLYAAWTAEMERSR